MIDTLINLAGGRREAHRCIVLATLATVAAASPLPAATPSAPAAAVQRQDAGRVVFRVTVPDAELKPSTALPGAEHLKIDGYQRAGTPGAPPTLFRVFFVGLPPEGDYSFSYRVVASTPLGSHRLEPVAKPVGIRDEELGPLLSERVEWNEEVYRAYRDPAAVVAEAEVYIRHQRAFPLRVNPVSFDPATQSLSVAKEIEVEVRFAAPRAQAGLAGPRRDDKFDAVYGRLLVNARQASEWEPTRAVPTADFTAGAARVAPGAVKVRVRSTGMHTVRASRAISSGFPAGTPITQMRLFRRYYNDTTLSPTETDIAFDVSEDAAGTAGVFDGNDEVVFYGRRLRDDATQADVRESYSAYNVYWLEPVAGTRMIETTPPSGFVSADTALAAFPVTAQRFETDVWLREATPSENFDIYYYNLGSESGPVDMPFTMGYVKPGTDVTLAAELHGQTYDFTRVVRLALANSKGEKVLADLAIQRKTRVMYSTQVPAADFDLGDNEFRINRPNASRSSIQALINFVQVSYSGIYRARGNSLRFNSATLAGDTSLTVTGITSSTGLELFDVTDPVLPQRLELTAGHFQPADGGTALSFRASLSGRREYLLVPGSRMIDVPASDLVGDDPSAIIGSAAENGIDVLVVAHHDFVAGMQQWVSYRRAQGYRVLMVDVEDVFDEFNGGIPHARAVQRFARHFFENGDAGVLLLVGDGSEDHKHLHDDSAPDFVPTFHRIDNVSELDLDEIVTTDKRMVKFPGPGGAVDFIPDMIVGRLPVGSPGELQVVLAKILAYEAPTLSDFWRKRMILVADDTFSESQASFGGAQYCYHFEEGFESGQEDVAQTIENSLPAGYDVVRFYLGNITDNFYPPHQPGNCANRFAAITYTRQNATEQLMAELNAGATWVVIQSHMNRYTITHERLLSGEPASVLNGATGRDYLRVENRFRPWIIFGMGCHFSQFAINREFAREAYNSPNGDAFAEQFLFQDERGAVGTYGSSGFEYLGANNDYMEKTAQVWFYETPYDTMLNQTQAEWKLGQLMYLTEAEMAIPQAEPVERYHILGDPLLRIDAGPPAFGVTVNGQPVESGDLIAGGGEVDSISVVAVVTDENALHKFGLEIDGQDMTDSLTVVRLSDPLLPHARQYRLSFRHMVMPRTYDIILRAYQSPDTTAGEYHMAAEFVLKVESSISVSVNGRAIQSGASVPVDGSYRIDLAFPVFIPSSEIVVAIDEDPVVDAQYSHPSPEDSLAWIITFRKKLAAGSHTLRITAQDIEFIYALKVSVATGLDHVINYPNPFGGDGTRILYSNEVEITGGQIDIYTISGKKVRRLEIPFTARAPGSNSVFWDGRDNGGGALANGTYLYVINVTQRGGSATVRGATTKVE